jgi:hypothetical protein
MRSVLSRSGAATSFTSALARDRFREILGDQDTKRYPNCAAAETLAAFGSPATAE